MNDAYTGGPAFPLNIPEKWYEGMTLRDYFAAKAMQALMPTDYIDANAKLAYAIADAMLKARNNQGKTK